MKTILIIEDEALIAELTAIMIGEIPNYSVAGILHTATNAIEKALELKPDLIL